MLFTAPGQALLVSQERKSRAVLSAKQPGKAARPAAQRLLAWFETIDPRLRQSITFDNGTEFAQHLILVDQLGIQTFFCDPHSPWQKGTIENAIGRLRRFLPRNTNVYNHRRRLPQRLHRRLQQHPSQMPWVQDPG